MRDIDLHKDATTIKNLLATYSLFGVSVLEGKYYEVNPIMNETPSAANIMLYLSSAKSASHYWTDIVQINLREYSNAGFIVDISYLDVMAYSQDFDKTWWVETLIRIEDTSGVQLPPVFYGFLDSLVAELS